MPVVEKTSGGRVYMRSLDRRFEIGDRADVSEDEAAYLCDERGDFERVEGDPEPGDETHPDADPEDLVTRSAEAVAEGKCGYYDPETMDDPCSRAAGWGRDADEGPCSGHVDELED